VASEPAPFDDTLRTALFAVAATAVVLTFGALVASGARAGLGVAVGGLLAVSNLWLLAQIARGVIRGGKRGRLWAIAGGLKFAALLAIAYLAVRAGLASGITLAIGYASLPVGIVVGNWISRGS
jgi:hypothetical protein